MNWKKNFPFTYKKADNNKIKTQDVIKEINNQYTKGLKFHYVSEMSEVIDIALTNKPVKNLKKL